MYRVRSVDHSVDQTVPRIAMMHRESFYDFTQATYIDDATEQEECFSPTSH